MSALSIQTSGPRLDIRTTNARIDITNRIRRFSAKRTAPQMKIERQAASYKVDWSQQAAARPARRAATSRMQNYAAQVATRRRVEPMVFRGSGGANSVQLENYKNAAISAGTMTGPSLSEITVGEGAELSISSVPNASANVRFDPGYMKVEWSTGELQIEWDDDFMPEITVTPHSVEIRITGHKEVRVAVDEKRIAHGNGKKVNKRV